MMGVLLLLCLLSLAGIAAVSFFRWWFSGGRTSGDASLDPALIAFGFPEDKYRAIARLLEKGELREIEHTMSSDLVWRLESGRREVLEAYLRELDEDFRCVQSLFAQAHGLGYVASPSAVRELVVGWWHFRWRSRALLRSARRGQLMRSDVDSLVGQVRIWYEKLAGVVTREER